MMLKSLEDHRRTRPSCSVEVTLGLNLVSESGVLGIRVRLEPGLSSVCQLHTIDQDNPTQKKF